MKNIFEFVAGMGKGYKRTRMWLPEAQRDVLQDHCFLGEKKLNLLSTEENARHIRSMHV
jgi:hypothetical protein